MAWLDSLLGEQASMGVKLALAILALGIVILLIIWLTRKLLSGRGNSQAKRRPPRLSISDAATVDDKRRLVLVRRDDVEHLIMIGGPTDIVVEQNIHRPHPAHGQQRIEPSVSTDPGASQAVARAAEPRKGEPAARAAPVSGGATGNERPVRSLFEEPAGKGAAVASSAVPGAAVLAAEQAVAGREGSQETVEAEWESASGTAMDFEDTVATAPEIPAELPPEIQAPGPSLAEAARERISGLSAQRRETAPEPEMASLAEELGDALGMESAPVMDNAPTLDTVHAQSTTEDEMQRLLDELSVEQRR